MPRRSADPIAAKFARHGLPFWGMTLVVVALHALPGADIEGQDWWSRQRIDLLLHAGMFGLWALTGLVALRKGRSVRISCRMAWPIIAVGGVLMALVLEGAQGWVFPDRGRDVADVLADVFGLLAAGGAFRALYLEWPMGKRTL